MTKEALEEDIRYWKSRFEELQKLYNMRLSQLDDWKKTYTSLEKENQRLMSREHDKVKLNGKTIEGWQAWATELAGNYNQMSAEKLSLAEENEKLKNPDLAKRIMLGGLTIESWRARAMELEDRVGALNVECKVLRECLHIISTKK